MRNLSFLKYLLFSSAVFVGLMSCTKTPQAGQEWESGGTVLAEGMGLLEVRFDVPGLDGATKASVPSAEESRLDRVLALVYYKGATPEESGLFEYQDLSAADITARSFTFQVPTGQYILWVVANVDLSDSALETLASQPESYLRTGLEITNPDVIVRTARTEFTCGGSGDVVSPVLSLKSRSCRIVLSGIENNLKSGGVGQNMVIRAAYVCNGVWRRALADGSEGILVGSSSVSVDSWMNMEGRRAYRSQATPRSASAVIGGSFPVGLLNEDFGSGYASRGYSEKDYYIKHALGYSNTFGVPYETPKYYQSLGSLGLPTRSVTHHESVAISSSMESSYGYPGTAYDYSSVGVPSGTGTDFYWSSLKGSASYDGVMYLGDDDMSFERHPVPASLSYGSDVTFTSGNILYAFPNSILSGISGYHDTFVPTSTVLMIVLSRSDGTFYWYPVVLSNGGLEENKEYTVHVTVNSPGNDRSEPFMPLETIVLDHMVSVSDWDPLDAIGENI